MEIDDDSSYDGGPVPFPPSTVATPQLRPLQGHNHPLSESRHAQMGTPDVAKAAPTIKRPRGRPPKKSPLVEKATQETPTGPPSLLPDPHTLAMRPPTPSPPNSGDEYSEYYPSDMDIATVEDYFNSSLPTPQVKVSPNSPQSGFQFWQSIRRINTPQGILISFEDQNTLTNILKQENMTVLKLARQQEEYQLNLARQQESFQKKIESFMSSLENKMINLQMQNTINPKSSTKQQAPTPRQITNPWKGPTNARVMNNTTPTPHTHTHTNPVSDPPTNIPTNAFLNQFKPSSLIIRKIPDTTPFKDKSPEDIIKITNTVLTSQNARTSDGTPIQIKAATILKSGDIKFFVQTRAMTSWLLANKHTWTHHCDPSLITRPIVFPVIIHSVPTSFSPDSPTQVKELCDTNNLTPSSISGIRWLGNPSGKSKIHSSIVINFTEKLLASQIEKGGLFFQSLFMRGAHYIKGPTQCFNCFEVGHTFKFCRNPPLCNRCGEEHNTNNCEEYETDSVKCHKCIKYYKNHHPESSENLDTDHLKFRHSATGALCPLRRNLQQQGANNS